MRAYTRFLQKRPLAGAAGTSMVLHGTGDVGAQYLTHIVSHSASAPRGEEKRSGEDLGEAFRVDWGRVGRFSLCGALLHGPFVHGSFVISDRLLGPAVSMSVAVKKTLLNQTVFAPLYLSIFFPFIGTLEGLSWDGSLQKMRNGFRAAFLGHCTVWPAALVLMFRFVPGHMRMLFANSVALGWNCALSAVNAASAKDTVVFARLVGEQRRK